MLIYVITEDCEVCWIEPIVKKNKDEAVEYLKERYEEVKNDMKLSDYPDNGEVIHDAYCEWSIEEDGTGSARINIIPSGKYWEGHITIHNLKI